MGIQDVIGKRLFNAKRKFYDIEISQIGVEQKVIALTVEEDKYGDRDLTVTKEENITAILKFPDNEVPLENYTDSNTSGVSLHLYDLLPIIGYFKFEDNIKKEDIILFKVRLSDSQYKIIGLQIVDMIARIGLGLTWLQYELAPPTLSLTKETEINTIIEQYYNSDWL